MPLYRVTWTIDIDADDPRMAAERAENYMNTDGARVYDVTEHKRGARTTFVYIDRGSVETR